MFRYPSQDTFPLSAELECQLRSQPNHKKFFKFHPSFIEFARKKKFRLATLEQHLQNTPHCVKCWALVASEFPEEENQWISKRVYSQTYPEGLMSTFCQECAGFCRNCQCGAGDYLQCYESHQTESKTTFCNGCMQWFCNTKSCREANFVHPTNKKICRGCCLQFYITRDQVRPELNTVLPADLADLTMSFVAYRLQK